MSLHRIRHSTPSSASTKRSDTQTSLTAAVIAGAARERGEMADFKDLTDDELRTKSALATTKPKSVTVEAMLRPKTAIDNFNRNSDKYSWRMLWLPIVIFILMLVQTTLAIFAIIEAFK